ncbi:MAG: amidohydrolase [Acidobacteriota bacterium]
MTPCVNVRAMITALLLLALAAPDVSSLRQEADRRASEVMPKVIAWRRDIHEHPELGNRETRTAALVAEQLRRLGYEVKTGVAHTGVVGVLQGGRPGPVVALRADMDALPVTEETDVPFASKVRTEYMGQQVGVMHACGHDGHTAILLGAAEILAGMRERLPGTVKLIFQPAEEGAPEGEEGGAKLMVAEGVLDSPKPDAMFALHLAAFPAGVIAYRSGPTHAGEENLKIKVRGRQTHAALPWLGVDPVALAAQMVLALELIPNRQVDPTLPNIISISMIHGGVRSNILPDEVAMEGTVRYFDPAKKDDLMQRIRRTVESIAESAGAKAEVTFSSYSPPNTNDPALTKAMEPTLRRVAGAGLMDYPPVTVSEDFAFFREKVPGMYVFLGINKPGVGFGEAEPNHSPRFYVNEDALLVGVRTMANLAIDYLGGAGAQSGR